MSIQRVAQIFGVVFLLVGILGLVTTPLTMAGGRLLGLFPVNLLHNVIHLVFGVWGLMAGRSAAGAVGYCKVTGVIYLVLTALAFVAPTTFGLVPIGGHDIWLHGVIGVLLTFVGFGWTRDVAHA
ncbi:MAG TPA: DUF4383 domain-containing protein [Acidimicrobiales bacterium]